MIDSVDLLQRLIRIDTTNPPGGERQAMELVRSTLSAHGIDVGFIARDPQRPNLIARVRGADDAPPLLLQGHMDVVPITSTASNSSRSRCPSASASSSRSRSMVRAGMDLCRWPTGP